MLCYFLFFTTPQQNVTNSKMNECNKTDNIHEYNMYGAERASPAP